MARISLELDPWTHERLSLWRAREAARKKAEMDWDGFFRLLLDRERKKREALSWAYALAIFLAITWILLWPVYLYAPALIPLIWAIGLIIAAATVYLLTPFSLRKYKPLEERGEIHGWVEKLAAEAGLRKTPLVTVSETPEINAMAYCGISRGRICLTRGLLQAYEEGKLSPRELQAILAHEIGHLRHGHLLKVNLALAWVGVFQYLGTETIRVSVSIGEVGEDDEGWFGVMLALTGMFGAFMGTLLLLVAKLASALSFHLSRRQEFEADDTAVELTHPEELAAALDRIERLNAELVAKELEQLPYADRWQFQPRNPSWVDRLWDTHPPTQSRIGRQRNEVDPKSWTDFRPSLEGDPAVSLSLYHFSSNSSGVRYPGAG